MQNNILNENFQRGDFSSEKGKGLFIFKKNKKIFDLAQSSGVYLFGHNHSSYQNSLKSLLKKKISITTKPNIYANKLFKIIKFFFPNFEKIIFCTTGSETVSKSLRIARSIKPNKKLLVSVSGSWHGSTDQTLFYQNKKKVIPMSAGLDPFLQKKIIFIPSQDIDGSKKILKKYRNNIYALIIEPVMCSLPSYEMGHYLKFLEDFCKKNKITLIFDEIVTGFRSDKKSVQNLYKIKPDITLIGKVLGGGFPISAIGISKKVSLKLKKKPKIYFGGTFSANSISTYIAYKNLLFIKKNIRSIFKLTEKCQFFQKKVNKFLVENKINSKIYRYSNILRIVFSDKNIKNRIKRDFFEKKIEKNKKNFLQFLKRKNINYPSNGIIFFPTIITKSQLNYLAKITSQGLKKYIKS